jgi:Domain of unknown function DUF11/Peptidase family C25
MSGDWGAVSAVFRGLAQGRVRHLALVAACIGALAAAPAALAGTVTIAPEADTFVVGEEGLTTTNYGGFDHLDTYGGFTKSCEPWGAPAYGLLRFPLGEIPAGRQLMDARFRLVERASYAQDGDPNHHIVFIANDAWGENTVTWATKPSDGTVSPGNPTLEAFPGGDIRQSVFALGSTFILPDVLGCNADPIPRGNTAHVFPGPNTTALKDQDLSERDLLTRLAGERGADGKLSVEVYNPNCPVCPAGANRAYWARYWSKEAADPAVRPRLTVRYADISLQASAPSPVAAGQPVRYTLTYKNDTTGPLTLQTVRAVFPEGFSYVAGSASGIISGAPHAEGATQVWDANVSLPAGAKRVAQFTLTASEALGSYDLVATGSSGEQDVGSATVTVEVVPGPDSVTASLERSDSSPSVVEAGADSLDIFRLPLEAVIHPASTPITQQPITQQPITQQPITQQPITQQPITQQPIAQMPITQFGFADAGSLALLTDVTLDTLPTTIPGGWSAILAGTALANAPPQGVNLRQVLALGSPLPSGITLRMGDFDWSYSKLRNLSIMALAYGSTPLSTLDPTGGGGALADWCATFAGPPLNCTNASSLGGQSVMSAALQGAPITQQPITQQPITQQPITQQPIAQMPIAQMPLQAPITQQPITQQPITQQPITQQELTYFATSSSPITQQPITQQFLGASGMTGLNLRDILSSGQPVTCPGARYGARSKLGDIPTSGLPATIVTATGDVNLSAAFCAGHVAAGATLATLGAVVDLTAYTIGDIGWYGNLTVQNLVAGLLADGSAGNYTVADLIAIMVNRQVLDWENLDPAVLSAFGTNRDGRVRWEATAEMISDGESGGSADLTATITLPPGFRYDTGPLFSEAEYAAVAFCGFECEIVLDSLGSDADGPAITTEPSKDGPIQTLTFTLPDASFNFAYQIQFATYAGFVLGPKQAGMTAEAVGIESTPDTGEITVGDTFEDGEGGNDTPDTAVPLTNPNTEIQESYVTDKDDVDYFTVHVPGNARVIAHLTNLSADLDLALLGPAQSVLKPTTTPGRALQDPPIRDTGVDRASVNTSLEPAGLQDTPITQQPITQHSINRNTSEEDAVGIAPPGGADFVIRIDGYNDAFVDRPYSLRVRVTDPIVEPTCTPRANMPHGVAGTPTAVPAGVNTLFVVDPTRLEATYPGESASVMSALTAVATGPAALGVNGYLLQVDRYSDVQQAYEAWDGNPCSVSKANAVAAAISAKIDALKAANPTIKYVVMVGGFDQIPAFAVPDLTRIANETGYASTFSNNQYFGAAQMGTVPSDDPYYDTDPVPIDDGQFFVADLIGGRLVETPAQIAGQLNRYSAANGQLDRSTAFAEGYDFTKDGAQAVSSSFGTSLGAGNVRQLINDTWTGTQLLGTGGLFPTAGASTFNLLNGHFDHFRMLTANGNAQGTIETVPATAFSGSLLGRVLFTVGCHSAFPASDVILGATTPAKDWPEVMGGKLAHWAGQTGYGYGDTDTVAYSEQLMSFLATRLDGRLSIGEALTRAKQDYYLTAGGTLSSYDRKALLEATMFGLPFYGVGVAPTAIPGAPAGVPVAGATNVTTPADGTLVNDPVSGQPSAEFSLTPTFTLVTGPKGLHYSNAGQVTQVNYRPIVPRVSLPATRPGQVAHYPFVESLESAPDEPNFNAAFSTPTIDLGSLSPEILFADAKFPSKLTTLVTTKVGSDQVSQLNVSTGQFFSDPSNANRSIGTMRRFTKVTGRVYYNTATNFVTTAIHDVQATRFGSNVGFVVNVPDVVRVLVLFRDASPPVNGSIKWKAIELTKDATNPSRWTGGSPVVGDNIEWIVQGLTANGNVVTSSNKARYFDAAAAPTGGNGIQIALTSTAPESPSSYFAGPVTVTATGPAGVQLFRRLDGLDEVPYTGPFVVSADGLHTVEFRGTDGSTGERSFVIDATSPLLPVIFTPPLPAPTTYTLGQVVNADYRCRDSGSGIATCAGTVGTTSVPSGTPLPTNSVGIKTLSVTGTDFVGHTGPTATRQYQVVWVFDGFFPPVDNPPVLNTVSAGQAIPVKFSLGGDFGLGILAAGSPSSTKVECSDTEVPDEIETTTTSSSGLSFGGGQYTYVWRTEKSWKGQCRRFTLKLIDGTTHAADFKFR